MDTVVNYLFGSIESHERFRATTEILSKFVSCAPRAVDITQLESTTGRPVKEIVKICTRLVRADLIKRDCKAASQWILVRDAGFITLEDVFRCIVNEQHGSRLRTPKSCSSSVNQDVDLLLMQAMITLNQNICKLLRQFSLDRLKTRSTSIFPISRPQFGDETFNSDLYLLDSHCD